MERYLEQTIATIESLRNSGWKEALLASDREGYSSMWQTFSTAARTAIENSLLSEGRVFRRPLISNKAHFFSRKFR